MMGLILILMSNMYYLALILIFLVVISRYLVVTARYRSLLGGYCSLVTARYRSLLLVPTFRMNEYNHLNDIKVSNVHMPRHIP